MKAGPFAANRSWPSRADRPKFVAPGYPERVQVLSGSKTAAAQISERLGGPQAGAYRPPAVGTQGGVSAAHGLAATAGLRILMQGGNAVDAAVAVGAALNVVEPYKSPCVVTRADGQAVLGVGTPGSFGILQTTLQVLLNRLLFGMNVQASIEAPRVRAFERTRVDVEARIAEATRDQLSARGHEVRLEEAWTWHVGGVRAIARDPDSGVLSAGADPRRDGQAVAF